MTLIVKYETTFPCMFCSLHENNGNFEFTGPKPLNTTLRLCSKCFNQLYKTMDTFFKPMPTPDVIQGRLENAPTKT